MVEYRIRMRPGDTRPDVLWEQIPDGYAVRVGRFMAAWSLIEFKLECIIWNLIGGDPKDLRRLTARLDARPKEETIDELLVTRPLCPEQMEAWAAAKQAIDGLSQHRNWLAHGVWLSYPVWNHRRTIDQKGRDQEGRKQAAILSGTRSDQAHKD